MSAQPLTEVLEKLLKLHKSLHQIALEKTEIIKKGDLYSLNTLLNQELAHISAIEKVEKVRSRIVVELLPEQEHPVLTDCLPLFSKEEQDKLTGLQEQLIHTITGLQGVNQLNQELLELSRQYVEINLDFFLPRELPNYSKTNEDELPLGDVSLFDSRA